MYSTTIRKGRITFFLLLALHILPGKAQMTDDDIRQMTENSFAAFKANKWSSFDNGSYWGWQTKDGTGYRYYWEQALCTMALEQQAEYGTSADAKQMVVQNLDGFAIKYGTGMGLGWNDYIDDIGWVLDAYCIGYRVTGKPEYLKYAKLLWNVGFTRGNLGPYPAVANTVKDGSQGLWWRVHHSRYSGYDAEGLNGKEGNGQVNKNQDHYKSPLSTSPHISGGVYLYQFTGDTRFLETAEKMWQWEVNTLWEFSDDSGIHEGYDPYRASIVDKDGNTQAERPEGLRPRRTMHDLSSFFEATNALWKATGNKVYLAWCWKIVNSVLYYRLDGNSVIQNKFNARDGSWCWEAGRAWTMFVADNNLWDFKGQVPLYEGTYTDYNGQTKQYTSKVQNTLKSIPNGWTIYQFMANSAKEIRNNNATCIILPTNRQMKNPWTSAPGANFGHRLEAELNDGVNVKWTQTAASGMTIKMSEANAMSGGQYVGYLGKGNYIEFFYTPSESGLYDVEVGYATANTRTIDVDLNGIKVYTMTCTNSGGWTTPTTQTISRLAMVQGNKYTLRFYNDTADMPNLDGISIVCIQSISNIENCYWIKNIGQQKYVKTGKSLGYDMPGLTDKTSATPQVLTEQAGGTWLIASPDYAAGWGVQGRNTIYESNNGSVKTNSWGTSITPGWQIVNTGEQENDYDVVYLKYTWGDYSAGSKTVTNPGNKTFMLHYGSYDLATDGWSDEQLSDVAQQWCYGGLESNQAAYGDNAKWVIIPLTSDKPVGGGGSSTGRTDDTVTPATTLAGQKIEAESGTFKQPDGDMAGRPDPIQAISGTAFSGGKKITNFGGLNWAEYTITADQTADYQIIVAYAINKSSYIEVTIDGEKKNIPVTSTGSNDTMQESRPVQFTLTQGQHTVVLSYSDDAGADLDYLLLNRVSGTATTGENILATITSPNGTNKVYVCMDMSNGTIYYRMDRNGQTIINNSSLGMNTSAGDYTKALNHNGTTTRTINETYPMRTGKASTYVNHCKEATLSFSKTGVELKMDLTVRAYDDGVAYRYYFHNTTLADGNFRVTSDNSRVVVNTYRRAWGQPWSYDYSKGMGKAFSWAEAQQLASDLSDNDGFGQGCFAAPLMIQSTLGDDYFVLISDGGVDQWFCRGVLRAGQTANVGRFDFLLRGEKNKGVGVSTKCPVYTPWRCAVVGSLKAIAETTMFENVTDATQPDPTGRDWAWVKGGFHTWDWGCTQNTQSLYRNQVDNIDCAKGYIDFNAKVGFKYYTLDEGWRTCTYDGSIDGYVKKVVEYANSKGQGVWLWQASGNWKNDLNELTEKFAWFKSMGAVGCKIDFFYDGDTRGVMQKQERIAEAAAKNGLMINFHGCPTPTGLRRKWPNIVSYEAVDGNEDYFTGGWNNTGTDPGYNGLLSIMRNAVGPMDYTVCEFRTGIDGKGTKRNNTSWTQQLAHIVTLESGNQWFSDAWQNVQDEANIMDAIKDAPTTWDESHCLYASVGDETVKDIQGNEDANFRVVWARRNGDNWYVGGTTNPAWTYTLDCSFLGDAVYKAVIFKDGADQTTVAREVMTGINKASKINVSCLERGGFYIRFEATDTDTRNLFYLYNVGAKQWIKTGGLSKNPDSPVLAAVAERTANVIVKQADGTHTIADPEYLAGWGVQGRNVIYESNNGSTKTNTWGTTLIPGWRFVSTGDADGSVYIEYTWGQWTKGTADLDDPSGKTYILFYGDWALGTYGWKKDTDEVAGKSVWSDLKANAANHGDYAKWLVVPVGNGSIDIVGTRGDINEDGRTDSGDVTTLAYFLSGQSVAPFNKTAADLNGDGNVSISDLAALVSLLMTLRGQ